MKVPKHGIIRNIRLRMSLVAPIHGRKLDGVSDEEHGKVVKDKVLDTLFGVKLCRPTSDIADCVAGSFFAADGGDSGEDWCLFADAGEELGVSEIRDILEDFKFTKGTSCLCMDASADVLVACRNGPGEYEGGPLRNAFSGKMGQDLEGLGVAQDNQATVTVAIANLLD